MRKDITIEKILLLGGDNVNKLELARQYECCWRTIDRRLNPDKYKKSYGSYQGYLGKSNTSFYKMYHF